MTAERPQRGHSMPTINPDRVLGDLYKLRTFGTYKTGVHRPTFSPEDVASRQWLVERMTEAGLDAEIDGIGNVFGWSGAKGRKILAGSHVESQNHAGWLDGPLGVIYALEAARALREDGAAGDPGIDVVAFCDEEGHFGSFLGSRSFVGDVTEAEIDNARDRTRGTPMREALAAAGYAGRPRLTIDPKRCIGYFEAHIEQGRTLETADLKIGVVTGLVGLWNYRITVEGQQNHAGTTMMWERRDAGLAMVQLLAAIDRRFAEIKAQRTVWTMGSVRFEPGEPSIIPGRAGAVLQFRDDDVTVLERLEAALLEMAEQAHRAGPCAVTIKNTRRDVPQAMDKTFQQAIDEAAARHAPGLALRMPSGAVHDAQIVARVIPAAMMFVPSIDGISHHWAENTADGDIVLGARVFADAIANVLMK
jgi:beta-ureidopropionase / N-carbamoyl-L-amino-acid hydrolase